MTKPPTEAREQFDLGHWLNQQEQAPNFTAHCKSCLIIGFNKGREVERSTPSTKAVLEAILTEFSYKYNLMGPEYADLKQIIASKIEG